MFALPSDFCGTLTPCSFAHPKRNPMSMRPHVPRLTRSCGLPSLPTLWFLRACSVPRGHSRPRTRHKSRPPRHKKRFSNIAPKSLFARRRLTPAGAAAAARLLGAMGREPDPRHGRERPKAPKTTLENSYFYKTSLKSGFFESTILSKSSKSRVVLRVWAGKRRGTEELRHFPSSCKNCAKKSQRQVIWRFWGSGRGFATSSVVSHIAVAFGAHFAPKRSSRAISEGASGLFLFPARFAARSLFSALFPHPFAAPRLRPALYARETPRRARSAPPLLKNARAESII